MTPRSLRSFGPRLAEGGFFLVAIGLCWLLGSLASDAWLARAQGLDAALPSSDELASLSLRANALFTVGVVLLAAARAMSSRRAREPLPAGLVLPAMISACLLGLVVHHATVDLAYQVVEGERVPVVLPPTAAGFAEGFALGCFAAAAIMAAPLDLAAAVGRMRLAFAALIGAIFAALAVVGSGPGASGVRINLGPFQPIEAVKVLFVLFLAAYLGPRAAKLRWQRQRILGLRWPRLTLLVPAVLVLLAIFAGLFLVGDLGPVLILALVFLGMFYLVTRASGWAALSIAIVALLLGLAASFPELVSVGRVATRIRMWRDPFWNDMPYGDQLGEALWAIAAGGPFGQGLGQAWAPLVPAGKTDLVLATLAEQLGAAGLVAYLGSVAAIVASGLYIASKSRTPERVLLAGGASLTLLAQWATIHAGTFALFPLTGVVVPFLSSGKSSMVAFVALVGLIVRLAEDGPFRSKTTELEELHAGARALAATGALVVLIGLWSSIDAAVIDRERIRAMGIATRFADGTSIVRNDPRLLELARAVRRGAIEDRTGAPIAVTERAGEGRQYPLGSAMGTLVGAHPSGVLLPPWALERVFDHRLRGYGTRTDGPTERPWKDLRSFAPLLDLSREERLARIRAIDADVGARSVRLSIDARLQREVAEILARKVAAGRGRAAAAVVLDVDTGQVLARAQVPDYDPSEPAWQERMRAGDRAFVERFTGAYGAWPDKTGLQGVFQSGSVGKIFTSLAAARAGWLVRGAGCGARSEIELACVERDAQGPFFTEPGWPRPIHDHERDRNHGRLGLVEALAVSCNVYFGQLALRLGPAPFLALRDAGVEVGYGASWPFVPGEAGSRQLASTGFGQGAMAMNVLQAARLAASVGSGGRYRACPATMELDAPCTELALVDRPGSLAPILAGMRRVMTSGTGRSLARPSGVRVYGKTGTADARGFAGEEPFGVGPGRPAPPHSWFVALAEPELASECEPELPGRLAIAVVVPRGGSGAAAAGPLAVEIIAAARDLGYVGGAR